jgi:hypothetical protein
VSKAKFLTAKSISFLPNFKDSSPTMKMQNLSFESILNLEPKNQAVFEEALIQAQERLREFANDPMFKAKMALAFGDSSNANALTKWGKKSNTSALPIPFVKLIMHGKLLQGFSMTQSSA